VGKGEVLGPKGSPVRALVVRARAMRLRAGCGVLVQRSPTGSFRDIESTVFDPASVFLNTHR